MDHKMQNLTLTKTYALALRFLMNIVEKCKKIEKFFLEVGVQVRSQPSKFLVLSILVTSKKTFFGEYETYL